MKMLGDAPPAHPPPPPPPTTGCFILVTGLENSGTAMVARILANLASAIGLPTDWQLGELSEAARARHEAIDGFWPLTYKFNVASERLWTLSSARRNATAVRQQLDILATQIRLLSSSPNAWPADLPHRQLVYHRSMPFGGCSTNSTHCLRSPILWDLPLLMQRLHLHNLHQVDWRSRAVIVLRQPPTMWASHTSALTSSALHFETYLGIIEAVLRRCCAVADAPCSRNASCPVFVRYERILEAPLVELRALVGFGSDAGPLDITSAMAHGLLASYELRHGQGHSAAHDRHSQSDGYGATVEANWERWRTQYESRYPAFVRVTAQQGHL